MMPVSFYTIFIVFFIQIGISKDAISETQYSIVSRDRGQCLDGNGGSRNAFEHACNGNLHQLWIIEPMYKGSSRYKLINVATGECLDNHLYNKNLAESPCHGGSNQQFRSIHQGEGYVQIRSVHDGKCMDARRKGPVNQNIYSGDCHNGHNQHWKIVSQGSGSSSESEKADLERQERELNAEIGGLNNETNSLNNSIKQRKSQIEYADRDIESNKKQIGLLEDEKKNLNQESINLDSKIAARNTTINELKTQEHNLQVEHGVKKQELENAKLENESAHEESARLYEEKGRQERQLALEEKSLNEKKSEIQILEASEKTNREASIFIESAKNVVSEYENLAASSDVLRRQVGVIYSIEGSSKVPLCNGFILSVGKIRAPYHCFYDKEDAQLSFETISKEVYTGLELKSVSRKKGFAILRYTPTGNFDQVHAVGSFDSKKPVHFLYVDPITKLALPSACKLLATKDKGIFNHGCETSAGAGGGVFMQGFKVVGFHLGKQESLEKEQGIAVLLQSGGSAPNVDHLYPNIILQ